MTSSTSSNSGNPHTSPECSPDQVVENIFSASVNLHAALDVIDDSYAAREVHRAIESLDQAVIDFRLLVAADRTEDAGN